MATGASTSRIPVWLWVSVGLSVLLSLYSIGKRYQVEAKNKAVAIAAEYEVVEALAAAQGISDEQDLYSLKAQGLNALVLSEETIGDLLGTGRATLQFHTMNHGFVSTLDIPDESVRNRVRRGISIRFGVRAIYSKGGSTLFVPGINPSLIRSTAIGLDPTQLDQARTAAVHILGRFSNPQGVSSRAVRETLKWAKESGVECYLPLGEQVLGRRDATNATIEALKELDMLYATPEFTKIGGDANIVAAIPDRVIRLHSAQAAELDKLPLIDAVERYGRAGRERNMRILLLRPVSFAADAPLSAFGSFIKEVGDQIRKEGGDIGTPKPFREPDLPQWWRVLIALAATPAVWFAFAAFHPSRKPIRQVSGLDIGRTAIVVGGILVLAALASVSKSGSQISTFLIALAYPVIGYLLLDRLRPKNVVFGFLLVSALSVAGALCVAGMLNGLSYYIQADEFRGVKLSVFLPIVLVGALFFLRLVDWQGTLRGPITWRTAGLGFVILIGLALMIARTGNDTGAGASSLELMLRNVLDRFLYVRPRTKEFLIGHPLLVIGVGMLAAYQSLKAKLIENPELEPRVKALGAWTTIVLMVSASGQTSIVNTMSHIHIPVLLSLARIGIGLVIGCIIGLVLWAILSRAALREES
ncbi:MAG: DUF5693 family protein [Fimbriimonas sp.]